MDFRVIIPVRYGSTRLPGKPLADIGGKTMVEHVYLRARESGAEDVIIATDDKRIQTVAEGFGATVCMTSVDHQSGTERLSEAVVALGLEDEEIVVCLQGDEPFIPPDVIRKVAEDLAEHENVKVSTVCTPIENVEDLFNTNVVKVVMNHRNYALYFSRSPIPWQRDCEKQKIDFEAHPYYRHIGIYGYRAGFLQEYMAWEPCPAEKLEMLEQLRILWHGGRIHLQVHKDHFPPGIDTESDLKRAREAYKN